MNPDKSVFENLAFSQVNLETVLLSEVVDPVDVLDQRISCSHISFLKRYLIIFKIIIKIFLSYI